MNQSLNILKKTLATPRTQFRALFLFSLILCGLTLKPSSYAQNFDEQCGFLKFAVENAIADRVRKTRISEIEWAKRNMTEQHPSRSLEVHYKENKPLTFLLAEKEMAWASDFYPFFMGGIARRWQKLINFENYTLLNQAEQGILAPEQVLKKIKSMPQNMIDELSATEKMDILLGNYDFKITAQELKVRGPKRELKVEPWEGFCNGRCAAAIMVAEPSKPVTMTNADGIKVTFLPADIKALLSAAYYYTENFSMIGSPNLTKAPKPLDTLPNAGVFDLATTFFLTQLHRPFVIDKDPGPEIANVIVAGFSRQREAVQRLTGAEKSKWQMLNPSAIEKVKIKLVLSYIPDILPFPFLLNRPTTPSLARNQGLSKVNYEYELILNQSGEIINGIWTSKLTPDFAWFPGGKGMDAENEMGMNRFMTFQQIFDIAAKSVQ